MWYNLICINICKEGAISDKEINVLTVKEAEGHTTKIINKTKKIFKK